MKKGVDYPSWMDDVSINTMNKGQLAENENVFQAFDRVANAAACRLLRPELKSDFKEAMDNGWLCPATPVLSNLGTTRGLPISCFSIDVDDSLIDIYGKVQELALLTAMGGGVGVGFSRVRGRGEPIRQRGQSEGTIPWMHVFDSAIVATSQGSIRRGASSINLHVRHKDVEEFLRMRRPEGDANRQNLNVNHCLQITDEFMMGVISGNEEDRRLWIEILKTRFETGEPYLHFIDSTNKQNPKCYTDKNLEVSLTNICSEITLYTDPKHSFVCCLSSLNLAKYDEWKDHKFSSGMTLPELSAWFLEGVMEEFISRASSMPGLENSVRFAKKGRPLGIGVLGWHSFLQSKKIPFAGMLANSFTNKIFSYIKEGAEKATKEMAEKYGEPEWCKGHGRRNTHLMAVAPTVSNASRACASPSIEPWRANAYNYKGAQGVYLIKNPELEKLLKEKGKNTKDVWKSIETNEGSVQHLDFLTDNEREVFLTFSEINQIDVVRQAAIRQKYIDQAQSVNLCFPADVEPKYIHNVHVEAWKKGLKTLYYCRSTSIIKADVGSRKHSKKDMSKEEDCTFCEG
jgi:ribonucleoside-diphosphate reductase alpha chain